MRLEYILYGYGTHRQSFGVLEPLAGLAGLYALLCNVRLIVQRFLTER